MSSKSEGPRGDQAVSQVNNASIFSEATAKQYTALFTLLLQVFSSLRVKEITHAFSQDVANE